MGVSNWLIIDFSKYHTIKKNNRLQGLPATMGGILHVVQVILRTGIIPTGRGTAFRKNS